LTFSPTGLPARAPERRRSRRGGVGAWRRFGQQSQALDSAGIVERAFRAREVIQMTKRHDSAHPTAADMRVLWDMNGMSFELAEKAYRAWLAGAGRIQNEALGFFNGRLEKGLETARELSNCRTPNEYFQVQAKYTDEVVAEWLAESQKMIELFGEIARTTAQPAQDALAEAEAMGRRAARRAGTH
jgi:hypothetical protein